MTTDPIRDRGCGAAFVVSAPSGAGKSTLVRRLLETLGGMRFSVSYTTRPPRPREEAGRDYHFVDAGTFEAMRARGEFLEWAEVHGHLYGTARSALEEILADGDDALLDLDVQGAEAARRALPDPVLIFVLPPDHSELRRRLEARGTPPAELERRLETARREIHRADLFDYLVVNERLPEAEALLEAIVLAERSRRTRRRETWEAIAATFPA